MGILNYITWFATAGGGGSSSGGGDSGDGGGGIIALMFMIGFAPTEALGCAYRRRLERDNDAVVFAAGQMLTWAVAGSLAVIAIIIGWVIFDELISFLYITAPLAVGLIVGAGDGLYRWLRRIKPNKKVKDDLASSARFDLAWDEADLKQKIEKIYRQFQRDWSTFDLASARTYLTDRYYDHVCLMLQAMRQMNRRNDVKVENIEAIEIASMYDDVRNNDKDSFVAGISAKITDRVVKLDKTKTMFRSSYVNDEYWHFVRDGDSWRLDGITPLTTDESTREQQIQQFAVDNHAYYSLDWGRLLIPSHGQLFGNGSMASSDINNHVIGRLLATGRAINDAIIFQIYTYSEAPARYTGKIYLIGQITVPKDYGDIVVRSRKGILQRGIRGLEEVKTEWADFNQKYRVFASVPERVASLELLNPQMMQWLEAAPFEVNLEVIDNSIYFYAPLRNTSADNYATMLSILQAAYRELKL